MRPAGHLLPPKRRVKTEFWGPIMRTALYYPHTEVQSEGLVRDALLTWDHLEYIAPYAGYQPRYGDRSEIAEAMEVIGRPRVPSGNDHMLVHELIVDLFDTDDIPEMFLQGVAGSIDYEIWPQKLPEETWRFLRDKGVIAEELSNSDGVASEPGGLALMSLLADVLAGETRARVTDRVEAYRSIAHLPNTKPRDGEQLSSVVPLTFKALSLSDIPLRNLIDYRKREYKEAGDDLRICGTAIGRR
jgi:hypothetical protein